MCEKKADLITTRTGRMQYFAIIPRIVSFKIETILHNTLCIVVIQCGVASRYF
jgi:hypothetical protein